MLRTVECRYNAVKFVTILHSALQWQWQNVSQTLDSQNTPHTSPSRASYGVSFVSILEKIDRVLMAPYCIKRARIPYNTANRLFVQKLVQLASSAEQQRHI